MPSRARTHTRTHWSEVRKLCISVLVAGLPARPFELMVSLMIVRNHLEERLLDQAQARASYTPFFGVVRVAYPNVWFLTSNPLENHHFRTKNDPRMIFWILTPVPPRTGVPFFEGGGGGGAKLLCVLWPLCVYLDLGPEELFSCIWTL